jgi:hypothetical protein
MGSFRGTEPDTRKYTTQVVCNNCDFRGEIELEIGMRVNRTPCPDCQNYTLEREIEAFRHRR